MGANPSDVMYWNDWEADQELKMCSLAAQGLWMRLLCIAAKAKPKGYVLVNGETPSLDDLAKPIGRSAEEISPLLDELSRWGVFSRDSKGRIFNRKMVRRARRSEVAKKNGKLGGNPKLLNGRKKKPQDKPEDKPPDKLHTSNSLLHSIFSKEKIKERMEAIWSAYPHPLNRGAKPYAKFGLISVQDAEDFEKSLEPLRSGLEADRKRNFDRQAPMFQTFLNQRRWEGLLESVKQTSRGTLKIPITDDPKLNDFAADFSKSYRADVYASWFVEDRRHIVRFEGETAIFETSNETRAETIQNRFGGFIDDYFGKGKWKVERI